MYNAMTVMIQEYKLITEQWNHRHLTRCLLPPVIVVYAEYQALLRH
jgi:hypothetical protein